MKYKITETKTITREIDVLPCPFCGSDNIKPFHTNGFYGYSPSTDGGNNQLLAIQKWNTRVDNKEARKE